MTLVVQATCPGCKNTLRIPAQWINQAMRCKHCGMVLQAKATIAGKTPAPPTSAPTPAPPTMPGQVPVPPSLVPGLAAAEKRSQSAAANTPLPPTADRARLGNLLRGSPSAPPGAVPRSGSGWRKGLFLALCVLIVAGIASTVYWPQLAPLLSPPTNGEQVQEEGKLPDADKPVPVAPAPSRPAEPPTQSGPAKMTDPPKPPESVKPMGPIKPPVPPGDPPPSASLFPRRALAVSVSNYLYANPVNYGSVGRGGRNVQMLLDRLHSGLRVPTDQLGLLSDAAPTNMARPPLKPVIENTINNFLDTSRDQDRILIMFIGHAVEIEDEPYLVPLEGDLEVKETLVPLKWLYERLASCRARQKVLVLDVCRLNPSRGQERPGSGPMGEKLDAALKAPPAGVQVWTACVAGQHSYEFEYAALNNGVFQEALYDVLGQLAQDDMQGPDGLLPMPRLAELVNAKIKNVLDKEGKVQTSRLSGQAPAAGAPFDSRQPRPPRPAIDTPPPPEGGPASAELVRGILKDLEVPAIKLVKDEQALRPEAMPVFSAKRLEAYRDDGEKTPFREMVVRARTRLNAHLEGKRLREEFRAPANEARFKDEIRDYQARVVATLLGELTEALDELKAAGKLRDQERSKRWQANYDYMLARLEMQIAYLHEYTALLGAMRQALPARDPQVHGGWRLASQPTLQGDTAGKRLARDARKVLEKLAKDHPNTPYEVLAKRERFTALGLDWQPTK